MTFNYSNNKTYNILGVNISFLNYDEVINLLFDSPLRTFTCVNQYYLNLAVEDSQYGNNLKYFDVIHPDGVGINVARKFLYKDNYEVSRINGSDLYYKLIERTLLEKKNIFFLGDSPKVIKNAYREIKKLYPEINISGYHDGYFDIDDESIVEIINSTNSYLLFVGLGVKRQEYWTMKWHDKLNVEKIINIGGGFRVISKDRSRGPLFVQKLGLEWLVRLIQEPNKNWKRYLIGIPLFLFRVIRSKYSNDK